MRMNWALCRWVDVTFIRTLGETKGRMLRSCRNRMWKRSVKWCASMAIVGERRNDRKCQAEGAFPLNPRGFDLSAMEWSSFIGQVTE